VTTVSSGPSLSRSMTAAAIAFGLLVSACGASPSASLSASRAAVPSPTSRPSPSGTPTPTREPAPTPSPIPTPVESTVDGLAVRTLSLGGRGTPVDVAAAFGSIWVANHKLDAVTRLDPDTMSVIATIKAGEGPGWFAVTDDAVWVSDQNGTGMTRIDPETNEGSDPTGHWAPCGRATVALGSIWQPACDAHRIMRIDPTRSGALDVDSPGKTSLIAAGTTLIAAGWDGLARLDPTTYAFTPLGGHDPGWLMAFDGRTIWASNEREVLRIRPADGSVAAKLSIPEAGGVAFRDGAAWVTSSGGVVEVDPATNVIVRTLPIGPSVAVVSDGPSLWVTSYGGNSVTEIRP
jgi:hypothetical protein